LPADGTATAIVERVMSAVETSDSQLGPLSLWERVRVRADRVKNMPSPPAPLPKGEGSLSGTQAETIHPTLLTRSLSNWRWMMRSPVSRVAAAVVFVVAVGAVAVWFHGGGATPTFADIVKPILEAKSAKYKVTKESEGKITGSEEVMWIAPDRLREEHRFKEDGKEKRVIVITDYKKHKRLVLDPGDKSATVTEFVNVPEDMPFKSIFVERREQLLSGRDKPGITSLGEKKIDGRRAVGYRMRAPCLVMAGDTDPPKAWREVWADPETMLPVREEFASEKSGKVLYRSIQSDYAFNLDLDESLFSLEPPAGYTVRKETHDYSPPTENDLMDAFRQYCKLSGGPFPDSLDMSVVLQIVAKVKANLGLKEGQKPTKHQRQELEETESKLFCAPVFADRLSPKADGYYAGKGVSLGAADKPIFWYRPKDAKKYRVIYADLSVRDAETPPKAPNAQPVPGAAKPKK